MKKALYLLILLLLSLQSFAQFFKQSNAAQFSIGLNQNKINPSLAWEHQIGLLKNKKLLFNFGLRASVCFASKTYYQTADPKITKNTSGVSVLFTEAKKERIDSLLLGAHLLNATNLFIGISYSPKPNIELGFNIDVLGLSVPQKYSANFIGENTNVSLQAAQPLLNLLLIADNDKGFLNSNFYFRYFTDTHLGFSLSLSHLITELNTNVKTSNQTMRYRNVSNLISLGIILRQ